MSAPPPASVVTVGSFDGVHRGHLDVIARLVACAAAERLRSVAVTFDPHPLEVVNAAAAPQLLTVGYEKLEVLAETGLGSLVVLRFTPALAAMSAEEFVEVVLVRQLGVRHLLVGHDHGLGRQRAGNPDVLRALGDAHGFRVSVVDAVGIQGRPVSSTAIRRAVAGGDLPLAAELLGRPYAVSGTVVHGDHRGRALGFPTLNLSPPSPRKLLPPDGIYAVHAQTPRGPFGGMTHVGPRPTFGEAARTIETYLFDAAGDFYGDYVRLDFVRRLRNVRAFATPAALVEQIRADEAAARSALTPGGRDRNLKG